jgi:hypothetical protein
MNSNPNQPNNGQSFVPRQISASNDYHRTYQNSRTLSQPQDQSQSSKFQMSVIWV